MGDAKSTSLERARNALRLGRYCGLEALERDVARAIETAVDEERVRVERVVAAYLLERADQYETNSGDWEALADAAVGVVNGAAHDADAHGEFDNALMARVARMKGKVRRG